ncbi:MAG TPA: nucleotide disphospho-sugar-binding domain-containing protein [Polyangiaceae bacterium]|nr:nucleotide disphospho-sugar-binding domain-containing protein [Polyangiaceae bacterium]
MARFLFCSYAATGHVTPLWPVASALRARGHEVGVLTAPGLRAKVEGLGLRHFATRAWDATFERFQTNRPTPRGGLEAMRKIKRTLNEHVLPDALRQLSDLEAVIGAWSADVVIGTVSTFGVSLAAERTKTAWATHAPQLTCPLPSRDLAPWGVGALPPRDAAAKTKAALQRGVYRVLNGVLSREWAKMREREGLPRDSKYLSEAVFSPYLYTIPSPAAFDFPRSDLPPQVHYVGPCLLDEGEGGAWRNPFTNGDPLVYCTSGTVSDPRALVRAAIEAVRGQRVNLFVTLGPQVAPSELGDLPPNVAAASFVPQHLVLEHASAVICNGGSGAVMGALAAGRPLVVMPQIADQPENAARCVALGAGVTLPQQRLSPAALRQALFTVLDEPSYAAAARQMAASVAATKGPAMAARLLERLAETKRPVFRDDVEPLPESSASPGRARLAPLDAAAAASPGELSQSRVVRVDRSALREKVSVQS